MESVKIVPSFVPCTDLLVTYRRILLLLHYFVSFSSAYFSLKISLSFRTTVTRTNDARCWHVTPMEAILFPVAFLAPRGVLNGLLSICFACPVLLLTTSHSAGSERPFCMTLTGSVVRWTNKRSQAAKRLLPWKLPKRVM